MTRCPNCFRETMRTKDWACYLCGYPLASPSYKLVDKTYSQIRDERLNDKKISIQESEQPEEISPEENPITDEMQDVPLVDSYILNEKPEPLEKELYETVNEVEISEEATPEPEIIEQVPIEEPEKCKADAEEELPKKSDEPESFEGKQVDFAVTEAESLECNDDTAEEIKEEEPEIIGKETITDENIPSTGEEEAAAPAEPETETEPEPADLSIPIDELLSEYTADYTTANTKFINKIIRLSGYAAAIDTKEVLAIHYIRMTDSSLNVMRSVQCMFDKKYADTLRSLQKGQQITVQGKYTGSLIAMRLSECILIQA
jgi:hypothetical protein